jgi:hypothetical protein
LLLFAGAWDMANPKEQTHLSHSSAVGSESPIFSSLKR